MEPVSSITCREGDLELGMKDVGRQVGTTEEEEEGVISSAPPIVEFGKFADWFYFLFFFWFLVSCLLFLVSCFLFLVICFWFLSGWPIYEIGTFELELSFTALRSLNSGSWRLYFPTQLFRKSHTQLQNIKILTPWFILSKLPWENLLPKYSPEQAERERAVALLEDSVVCITKQNSCFELRHRSENADNWRGGKMCFAPTSCYYWNLAFKKAALAPIDLSFVIFDDEEVEDGFASSVSPASHMSSSISLS